MWWNNIIKIFVGDIMSYMSEYINQNFDIRQLEQELINLINEYDTLTGKHLFIYSVDFNNYDLPISMDMDDLYTIKDVLREDSSKKLSFYIETPGGLGTAAEEIAILLRNKYEYWGGWLEPMPAVKRL